MAKKNKVRGRSERKPAPATARAQQLRPRRSKQTHGIALDERGQEQPTDKEAAQR
jgi:hypothetical protein